MLEATLEGVGFWGTGLPDWDSACAWMRKGERPLDPPARPSPQLLAANERRRAPGTVAVALEAALAACEAADRAPATLPSVFTSTHGELTITDYMCATLATDPAAISPTKFHNSVHNAAAGYWTIGAGAHVAATAISAGHYSFAQGLLEAMVQLHAGEEAVLLVAYDGNASGPAAEVSPSTGLLGAAFVLSRSASAGLPGLQLRLHDEAPPMVPQDTQQGPLLQLFGDNAMHPALTLLEALAMDQDTLWMRAGSGQWLEISIRHE
ncbi:MAG: beta-ketoacyl synthase chain length factor [Stenotrophomonas sp.]